MPDSVQTASRHSSAGTVFDEDTSRTFGIVVGVEFAAAAAGAVVLAVLRRRELTSAWIGFVVGVHLFPVAAIIGYPFIYLVGVLVTIVSLVGVPIARARNVAPSAIVGAGSGTFLLVGAIFSAVAAAIAG
ncbi:hypothetical protein ACQP2E_16210 [Actinoplanes sp. CA-015351]|uniref:hypothetical protein n=1 Tax=Actinoplanes sp. CA-015351 TaxID=3239897 RepID=UPI003D981DF8